MLSSNIHDVHKLSHVMLGKNSKTTKQPQNFIVHVAAGKANDDNFLASVDGWTNDANFISTVPSGNEFVTDQTVTFIL